MYFLQVLVLKYNLHLCCLMACCRESRKKFRKKMNFTYSCYRRPYRPNIRLLKSRKVNVWFEIESLLIYKLPYTSSNIILGPWEKDVPNFFLYILLFIAKRLYLLPLQVNQKLLFFAEQYCTNIFFKLVKSNLLWGNKCSGNSKLTMTENMLTFLRM